MLIRMLLKSVDMLANIPKIMTTKNLHIFPRVKYKESASILQFLLNINLKQR